MMKIRNTHRLLLVLGVLVALVAAFWLIDRLSASGSPDNILNLQEPPFVDVVRAETLSATSVITEEAGIAAYAQAPWSIDLSAVRGQFRTIERETAEYIIGSVGIPDYSEDHDPHVYVHADGWVLAYYLAAEPASYMMDLKHYDGVTIGTTKLEDAMYEILSAVGVASFDATFYDFRYPNATNLMLIAETMYTTGDALFSVYLPVEFTYYDRSWSHGLYQVNNTDRSTLYLDENSVNVIDVWGANDTWWLAYGHLTTSQLPPGISHNVRLHLYEYDDDDNNRALCAMALVYREGP